MVATSNKTATYKYGKNYLVDIVTTEDEYESWLWQKDYGVKHFMFGAPKEQQSYFEFFELVHYCVEDYIDLIIAQDNWLEEMA